MHTSLCVQPALQGASQNGDPNTAFASDDSELDMAAAFQPKALPRLAGGGAGTGAAAGAATG